MFLYTRSGTTWSPDNPSQSALTNSDGSPFDTVAVDGNTLVAGAAGIFVTGATGAVYVFEPPSTCQLTCPTNITVCNDLGVCGALVKYTLPTTSGNCGTINCTPASGALFPV